MDCKVCYICGKTPEEVEKFLNSTLESISINTPEVITEQNAAIDELEKLETAIESKDFKFLSQKNMLAILLTEQQLTKFGSWTRKKLAAAKECDYPFEAGELELIEHIFPGSCSSDQFNNTIQQWYEYSNKMLEKMKSKIPQSKEARDILSSNGYHIPPIDFKEVKFGQIYKGTDRGYGEDAFKSIPLNAYICPICNGIIESKINSATSGYLLG